MKYIYLNFFGCGRPFSLCHKQPSETFFVHFNSQELAKLKAEAQTPEVAGEDGINPVALITEETKKKETRFIKHELEGEVCENDELEDGDMAKNTDEANEVGSAKEQ
jgi:hypothetical protein